MKSYRDKNDFEVNPGEDWDDKKSDETIKYMTGKRNMETFVKNNNANNANPGTFKKLVKEDEKIAKQVRDYAPHKVPTTRLKPLIDIEKILEENEDDYVSKRGEQTIALANTAGKLKGNINKNDYVLKEDGNGLMVNKNRTIAVRDSFVAKQFNRALGAEPEATPEQFGKLAANLERNRQMQGKGTDVNKFKKNFNKPIQKKTPTKPFKFPEFKIDPVLPISYFKPPPPDPELIRLEQNFNRMLEESNRPKGLPGILGLNKKI
jgi:hypothetical protein